ncbi:3-ketoacyl-CoA synthase 4-like [Aegilops tauschii subsp. strangulata]|uniref:very-long-chain 3-oxoacyl-CoA synthase n=1 Tax=Aegilops tauschii TaxID=37682 RepID=M8BEF9_AEGTA
MLLSSSRSKARFRLTQVVRTITASDDNAYRCVYQEEDDEGIKGANLSKNLMAIAGDALKANITAMGPLVLPTSELIKFLLVSLARKVLLGRRIRPYIPNFHTAFEHFCIHVGGPVVISSVQRGLNLSYEHVEPSWMTLHQFGNQSSASVWYELGYIEAKGRMLKGNRVWMIGFGAGYECNSAVWVCIHTSHGDHGPWARCIHRYPLDVQK